MNEDMSIEESMIRREIVHLLQDKEQETGKVVMIHMIDFIDLTLVRLTTLVDNIGPENVVDVADTTE